MRYRLRIAVLTSLLVLVVGVGSGIGQQKKNARPPSPVEVTSIKQREVRQQITLIGSVEAFSEGDVHSEVQGLVETFPVREGTFVKQGTVLATLNASQLDIELQRMKEDWEQVKVLYEKEKREHERFKGLSESRSVSIQELDKEWSEAESARFRKRMLESSVRRLEDRLSKKTIKAPFDGYVVREYVQRGTWVEAGGKVVSMVKVDPIFVRVPFPQNDLPKLQKGDKVEVVIEAFGSKPLQGKINTVIARGDTSSRTFPVKVVLANPKHRLIPGMLAYVTFPLGNGKTALVVPKDAVVTTPDQRTIVYLVRDGKAFPSPVKTGQATGRFIEILGEKIKEGLTVVTVGNERLRPGQAVSVIGPSKQTDKSEALGRKTD